MDNLDDRWGYWKARHEFWRAEAEEKRRAEAEAARRPGLEA
jgi:hypothetical protein